MGAVKKISAFRFLLFASLLLASIAHYASAYWNDGQGCTDMYQDYSWKYWTSTHSCGNLGFCGSWGCYSSNHCGCYAEQGDLCGPSYPGDYEKCGAPGQNGPPGIACIQQVDANHQPINEYRCGYKIPLGSTSYCRGDGDCDQGSGTVHCSNNICTLPQPPAITSLALRLKAGTTDQYECVIKAADPNSGDTLVATYDWHKDNDPQPPQHQTKAVANGAETELSTMQASDMGSFSWKCSASVSDGTFTSSVSFSNTISACGLVSGSCSGGPNAPGTCCGTLVCSAASNGQCTDCGLKGFACTGGPGVQGTCCVGYKCSAASGACLCGHVNEQCAGSGRGSCCYGSCNSATGVCACGELYDDCGADTDCCSSLRCMGGRCRPNNPPNKPPAPSLAMTYDGKMACAANCPPSPLPADPDPGDSVEMKYSWNNGAAQPAAGTFDCGGICTPGTTVTLKSIACDQRNACSESDTASITVPSPPVPSQGYLTYIIYALLAAFSILALAYMLSKIFNLPHWVPIISDELLQLLATGGVAILLVSMQAGIDGYLVDALYAAGGSPPPGGGAYEAAHLYLGAAGAQAEGLLNTLATRSTEIGKEASKGIYCTMLGAGFTLPSCSPLNAFRGSLTSSAFTVMVGVLDVYAQQFIITLGHNYAFSMLLPLGLFFRCFKLSRQAGGALIAIAVGFYMVYPLSIIAVGGALAGINYPYSPPGNLGVPQLNNGGTCDPYALTGTANWDQFNNYALALSENSRAVGLTYLILVKVVLLSVLNLLITLGFIAAFAKLLGSDIDVSGLARIG